MVLRHGGNIPLGDDFPTSSGRIFLPEKWVIAFSGGSAGPGFSSEHPDEQR